MIYFRAQLIKCREYFLERTAITGNKNRVMWLNNLAEVYRTRYPQIGNVAELDQAILLLEEALHELPKLHPVRGVALGNLAHVFKKRFDHLGHLLWLSDCIKIPEI
jgi:hypothetical protein